MCASVWVQSNPTAHYDLCTTAKVTKQKREWQSARPCFVVAVVVVVVH